MALEQFKKMLQEHIERDTLDHVNLINALEDAREHDPLFAEDLWNTLIGYIEQVNSDHARLKELVETANG